ncbi:hypothetical protein NQ314_016801 [Rhamnusium bicolor]|uniref:Uncharacterized protein n=1 Tax=Rhamnusium bicolor TaxID=1586634 RepID=A0AAV8WVB0_9CUCU|nr:hypothetical protein NQ314_016801 [Rhamnusium bicolor]
MYEIPTNLVELTPPKLNVELGPLLKKQDQNTDSSHVEVQRQVGKGLSALGKGISLLLGDTENVVSMNFKVNLLSSLSDSAQILSNVFHRVSVTRKNLLSPLINKNVKDLVDKTPPTEFLFGSDLVEKIKTVKSVETLSRELKLTKPGYIPGIRSQNRGGMSQHTGSSSQTVLNLNSQRPVRRVGEARLSRGLPSKFNREDGRRVKYTPRKEQRRRV